MPLALVCLGGAVGFLAAAGSDREEAVHQERNRYEGTWRVIFLQVDGKQADPKDAKKITVVNQADGAWTILADGKEISKGTSTIDPTRKPKTLDFTPSEGPDKGKAFQGIYDIRVNCRKVCYAPPGKGRPTEFASPPGSGHVLVIFQREHP
jgi:uncharacterized protein (TIGR03067 family)